MDISLSQGEVVKQLWNQYKRTPDYKKFPKGILPHNIIVEDREQDGLRIVVTYFLTKKLQDHRNYNKDLRGRNVSEWLKEWKEMHGVLFENVLRDCGDFRKKDVTFGDPNDHDRYKIPHHQFVVKEISELGDYIKEGVNRKVEGLEDVFRFLAKVHYKFIRIHPFMDGNGRISRVLTDQLSTYYGLPPATAGYPRHNPKRRENYHISIRDCIEDSECVSLSEWIKTYVLEQLDKLA